MMTLFSFIQWGNLRIFTPTSFASARDLIITKLEAGAIAGNNTAMSFNRKIDASAGQLWDWLPVSEKLHSFLTKIATTLPNGEVKDAIAKLVAKDDDFDPSKTNLEFLDPTGEFTTHWQEITSNLLRLFLEPNPATGELAIQRFARAYNAKALEKSDVETFAQECVGSYVATLQGLYLNYVLTEIRAKDGNRNVNSPNAELLIDYYAELIKKLFDKTKNEVRQHVSESIEKEIRKTELCNIFDVKKVPQSEKGQLSDVVANFASSNASFDLCRMYMMVDDIKDFYASDVSYLDRHFLFKMLEKNYRDDPICRLLLIELKKIEFPEPIEGISNSLELERAIDVTQHVYSPASTTSTGSSRSSTPGPETPASNGELEYPSPRNSHSKLHA
jgi:hypothetical protein